ncbi:sensor histidine kinase [Microbacterium sp. 22195]|uniref:sensor histidine kinase n=1 Tax=Microbacterium sp. 22195 TaxID=3453891 RepID=UPI003F855377
MSARTDHAVAADRARVQRSALHTGLWVGIASAAVVTAVTATIITALLTASRPGPRPHGRPGEPLGDRILDLDDVLPVVIAMGVIGVLLLGVIAWYASRRASEPLAEALGVQRAFVADASHELRTPLTTLNSRIQLAEHRLRQGEDVGRVLADMRADAAVMDAVLTDLLLAAETAGARDSDATASASVFEALQEAAAVIGPRAAERGVRVDVQAPADLRVAAEQTALMRAVIALLDNAVRYSPDGASVQLTATPAGRRAEIRVADHGPGLGDMDPERVFERFARSTASTERRGFGLGLALVRDIANRFGGSVEVERTSAAGTTFLLTLPRA